MSQIIYAFDIFDTCLVRTFARPTDLFYELAEKMLAQHLARPFSNEEISELARLRIEAEQTARQNSTREDITLDDIYRHIQDLAQWEISAQTMMQAEIQLEIEAVRPVLQIKQKIDALRQQGQRIIFISDMYLPQAIIRQMLLEHGLAHPDDRIYVSGEIGATKQSGNLFQHVIKQEGIALRQLWHHGDNPYSDVVVPRRLGIKTTCFRQSQLTRYERLIIKQANNRPWKMSKLAGISRAVRLQYSDTSNNGELVKPAANVIAPLLVGYVAWVLQNSAQKKIKRLYFVSRDGHILYKIAQVLAQYMPAPECRYLYGSRQAWFLPAVRKVNRTSLDWLMLHSKAPRHLLEKLNLSPTDVSDIFLQHGISNWDTQLDGESVPRFWQAIEHPEITKLILQRAAEARDITRAYFKQEGLSRGDEWSLVDIGWTLKTQRAVKQILQANAASKNIHGYYLGGSKERVPMAQSGPYSAYLLEPATGQSADLPLNGLFCNMGLIEQVFTMADHGSTTGYTYHNQKVEPVLAALSLCPQRKQHLDTLQKVVLAYAEALAATKLLCDIDELKPATLLALEKFLSEPTRKEAQTIAWIPIGEDQNETRRHQLARKLTLKDIFYYAGRLLKVTEARDFDTGFSWRAGSVALSGWWVRILFGLFIRAQKFRQKGGYLKLRSLRWKITGTKIL